MPGAEDARVLDADVVVVGAGPAGLMLAGELRRTGVRVVVLERQVRIREIPKAGGLGGRILEMLHYRGVLERLEAVSPNTDPVPRFPFGGVHVDLSGLVDPPMRAVVLAQPELERLLGEYADELGAEIRRGHEVVGLSQGEAEATVDVRDPAGLYRMTARYVVGCDGQHSRVRKLAGIAFPGTSYPEVNRFGVVAKPDSVRRLANGDLEVPGSGRISAGFTRTAGGTFALGESTRTPELLTLFTTEDELTEYDDDEPMTLAEFGDSIRRVLGVDLPLAEPRRLSRFTFKARQAQRYRDGRVFLAGDAAHLFPATGISVSASMLDTVNLAWKLAADIHGWAPAGLLDSYHDERRFAADRTMVHTQAQVALRRGLDPAAEALRQLVQELLTDEQPLRRMGALIAGGDIRYPLSNPNQHPLTGTFVPNLSLLTQHGTTSVAELMRPGRPILLDLADRADLREQARGWESRVQTCVAKTDNRPADALLIRPDAYIAWASSTGEPADAAATGLRDALSCWFGAAGDRPDEYDHPELVRGR